MTWRSILGITLLIAIPTGWACGGSESASSTGGGKGGSNAGGNGHGGQDGIGGGPASGTGTGTGAGATGGSGGAGSGGCRTATDCDGGDFCAAYQLEPLCDGMPDTSFTNDCQTDADCGGQGADFICDAALCVVPHGGAQTPLHCRKGCDVDADCNPGQGCTPTHHCQYETCTDPGFDCGPNLSCADGTCFAANCTTDDDCDDFCVNGRCSPVLGTCFLATP